MRQPSVNSSELGEVRGLGLYLRVETPEPLELQCELADCRNSSRVRNSHSSCATTKHFVIELTTLKRAIHGLI